MILWQSLILPILPCFISGYIIDIWYIYIDIYMLYLIDRSKPVEEVLQKVLTQCPKPLWLVGESRGNYITRQWVHYYVVSLSLWIHFWSSLLGMLILDWSSHQAICGPDIHLLTDVVETVFATPKSQNDGNKNEKSMEHIFLMGGFSNV